MVSKAFLGHLGNILIINQNFPLLNIVKSKKELGYCWFSTSRCSYKRYMLSRFDLKIKPMKKLFVLIRKINILKSDFCFIDLERRSIFYILDFSWCLDNFQSLSHFTHCPWKTPKYRSNWDRLINNPENIGLNKDYHSYF